ncbi:histone-lysine N-methyltransferase PRDM9-like [Acipenser oxyrinchus oxyrinchus]|uniref:Histone-lysine N-methyltransferase PRDM9-like n=1 Tax=Acipenser oxyrinchus oxyrinchus TaxID=40147 RepID=A0AAD8GG28_ACIOX|nr:histone-lysine N-methyltransferase PRDM9-like [Acipenser oxyrinchus oxyrinchus]
MYFSKKKWAELQEWEKDIYKNQKQNHEAMIAIGLNSPKPEFMRQPPRRRQTPVDDPGKEWIPRHKKTVYSNKMFFFLQKEKQEVPVTSGSVAAQRKESPESDSDENRDDTFEGFEDEDEDVSVFIECDSKNEKSRQYELKKTGNCSNNSNLVTFKYNLPLML